MDILSLSEFSKVLTAKQVASTLFGVPYHKVTAFALEDCEALLGDKRSNGAVSIVSGSGRGIKSEHGLTSKSQSTAPQPNNPQAINPKSKPTSLGKAGN